MQSKSNATKEIKQKLFLVQKNVFPQNFSPVYCRSGCTFWWAPTTAGSRRRPGLRSWNPWPPPRSSSSPPGSAWWHTADSFLWVTGNTPPRIYQAKIRHFWDPGSRRRPTKCTQRQRRAHQIWSLIVNFFTMHRTSSRMLKFVLIEPVGHVHCTRSFTVTRHPSQLPDGDSGDKILNSLDFLWNWRWPCSSVFLMALMLQIIIFIIYWR